MPWAEFFVAPEVNGVPMVARCAAHSCEGESAQYSASLCSWLPFVVAKRYGAATSPITSRGKIGELREIRDVKERTK